MNLYWFDILILIVIIFALIKGYLSGLIMQLAYLVGLVACSFFAGKVAGFVSPYLIQLTDAAPYILNPLSYIVAFLIIMIGFIFVGKMIQGFLSAVKLNFLNKLAGAAFCVLTWLFVISILVNLIAEFDKKERIIKTDIRQNSYAYRPVQKIAPYFIPFLEFDMNSKE